MKKYSWIALLLLTSCGPRSCVPNFKELKTVYPHVLYHGSKEPSEVVLKKYPPASWAPLSQISKKAQGAILVSEDWAFYQHHGYDEKQMREAIEQSIEEKKLKRGASTITQQVVKNIYLSKEKSVVRKVRELWMATKIEKVLGKSRILELYLNIAELGEGIFGVGQASRFYFHKSPSELSAKEGAFLAMLLPSPKKYAISYRHGELTPYARKIIRSVLNKMVMAHYISPEERDLEWRTPLSFEKKIDLSVPSDASLESEDDEVDAPPAPGDAPDPVAPTATPIEVDAD
jgi:monofunctional biosynthetic peptidoglycan transglycosylase